mgnify:CR=1 FL=1
MTGPAHTPIEPRRTVEVTVEGRVQGVGFRAWAVRTARQLSLDGWVRNMPDGSVEALLSGTPAAVDEMLVLLEVGPPAARVDRVTVVAEGGTSPAGFEARV